MKCRRDPRGALRGRGNLTPPPSAPPLLLYPRPQACERAGSVRARRPRRRAPSSLSSFPPTSARPRARVAVRAKADDLKRQLDEARKQSEESGAQLSVAQQALESHREQLQNAERDLEQARKEAREAEELFAAAADERAAKVKELVQEIDHWHDAAIFAQQMEQEARGELEEARRQLDESGGKASELDDVRRQADEARGRVEEAERLKREADERSESLRSQVEGKDVELAGLRGEIDGLREELDRAREELEGAKRDGGDAAALRGEMDALRASVRRIAPSGSAPPPPPRTPS